MSKRPFNNNRVCYLCKDFENRKATEYELKCMVAVKWMKFYKNNKWTGQYICSRCKSKNCQTIKRKKLRILKKFHK